MNDSEIIYLVIFGFIFFIIFSICNYLYNKKQYEKCTYYEITKVPYWTMLHDSGRSGEYSIYNTLKNYELTGAKFLFNLYIPTYNNKTTEIDVVMICPQGIFVFESKNYIGWIFGTETQRKWTQTLHAGYGFSKKEHFFNPIMQNEYHIKYLSKLLDNKYPFYSIIVFSDNCEMKSITRKANSDANLIYRFELFKTVREELLRHNTVIPDKLINDIYNKLYPYSQVPEETKLQHILNLK
jgi:hypothetical protein